MTDLESFIEEAKPLVLEASVAAWGGAILTIQTVVGTVYARWVLLEKAQGREAKQDDLDRLSFELLKAAKAINPEHTLEDIQKILSEKAVKLV